MIKAQIEKIAERNDWRVAWSKDDKYKIFTIERYAYHGYNFIADICYGSLNTLWNAVLDYWQGYDASEEAALWIGEDGRGKNGAPHKIRDILSYFEECEQALEILASDLRNAA